MGRPVLLLAGVLVLAACGTAADAGGGADVAREWQLREGTVDGAPLPRPAGATATLDLTGDEARGTAFCNHWFAAVRTGGDSFALDGIGSTEMGCAPEVMAAERAYLAALAAVGTAAVDGEELVLTGDGVELRFAPVAAVPDRPLAGTRWVLKSLVDGATASSAAGGPAVLLLGADGRARTGTGCRTLTATWLLEDRALVLDDLLPDGAACPPGLARRDEHVTAVVGAGPAVEVRGDRLTLTAPDGRGLVYRAEA
ncbi:META domain-containing protein [Blastococcus sp. SYSU D01042]